VEDLVEIIDSDARDFTLEPGVWDVALCLGATFVWDDLDGTLAALVPAVRPGGHVAVGEPFWRTAPPPSIDAMGSSTDDWDRYESLHWRAVEDWLAEQEHGSLEAVEVRGENERHKRRYLEVGRDHLGWAILVGRTTGLERG
jgi:hypothetical protein